MHNRIHHLNLYLTPRRPAVLPCGRFCVWLVVNTIAIKPRNESRQNRFIDCPVRFSANRLMKFFPSDWHREHQIVYVKTDLLTVAGRMRAA